MQALHFMFGLGGFLAPLLLKLAHHVEWGFRVRIAPHKLIPYDESSLC
jgi:hypothetical protein